MKNPIDIRTLADSRIKEAQALSKKGFYDLAFYVAGYAVELQLKAKICEHFDLPDFYSQYAPKTDLSKTFLIHNLPRLMLLSGLHNKFEAERQADILFDKHWLKVKSWSEQSRYDVIGTNDEVSVKIFIESLKIIIKWIKKQ